MTDFSEGVLAFIRTYIDSVEQLEMLLLLRRNAEREWTAEDVSRALSTQSDSAARRLAEFSSQGIIRTAQSGPVTLYRYSPQESHLDSTIGEVERAYGTSPVRLINVIFSKPIDKVRTFPVSKDQQS